MYIYYHIYYSSLSLSLNSVFVCCRPWDGSQFNCGHPFWGELAWRIVCSTWHLLIPTFQIRCFCWVRLTYCRCWGLGCSKTSVAHGKGHLYKSSNIQISINIAFLDLFASIFSLILWNAFCRILHNSSKQLRNAAQKLLMKIREGIRFFLSCLQ